MTGAVLLRPRHAGLAPGLGSRYQRGRVIQHWAATPGQRIVASMTQTGIARRYARLQRDDVLEGLRRQFRNLNRMMVVVWRLGLGPVFGRFPHTVGQMLVLHHVGRKSGRTYRSPVNYAEVGSSLFCVAAFGIRCDWYQNLIAHPTAEAWLPDGRWIVDVRDADDRPDRLDLIRKVLVASGFAAPAFGLHPSTMTDEALAGVTADYRLLEIVRREKLGRSVADLAWVWVVPGAMLAWSVRRAQRRPNSLPTPVRPVRMG